MQQGYGGCSGEMRIVRCGSLALFLCKKTAYGFDDALLFVLLQARRGRQQNAAPEKCFRFAPAEIRRFFQYGHLMKRIPEMPRFDAVMLQQADKFRRLVRRFQ